MSQYPHQHSQGSLAPTPSPLNPGGLNPINSPGPVEYISASRTGAGAGHDYAVYSGSVQGFGNGMVSEERFQNCDKQRKHFRAYLKPFFV